MLAWRGRCQIACKERGGDIAAVREQLVNVEEVQHELARILTPFRQGCAKQRLLLARSQRPKTPLPPSRLISM